MTPEEWEAERSRLLADANLAAWAACQHLLEKSLGEALVAAEEWQRLKQQLEAHTKGEAR